MLGIDVYQLSVQLRYSLEYADYVFQKYFFWVTCNSVSAHSENMVIFANSVLLIFTPSVFALISGREIGTTNYNHCPINRIDH